MKLRVLVVVLLLVAMVPAATKPASDMVGTWKFMPEKSNGGETFPPGTTLVVKQYGARMVFEYWANKHLFRRDNYRTDGGEEKAYTTPNEMVTIVGKMRKNELVITTNHIMENEIGSQSFSETDRWILSGEGKVLTGKSSDNKSVVFERDTPGSNMSAPVSDPAPAKK